MRFSSLLVCMAKYTLFMPILVIMGVGGFLSLKSVWIVPSPIRTKLFFLVNTGECPELVQKKGKKEERK
jgi:hypothetical protein